MPCIRPDSPTSFKCHPTSMEKWIEIEVESEVESESEIDVESGSESETDSL